MNRARSPTLEVLRQEIAELYSRKNRGDLPPKSFQKAADAKVIELFRAIASGRMDQGEEIALEHHVILACTRLDQMVLQDNGQELASLFATQRRLVEVRTIADKDVPPTCDAHDRLSVQDLTYQQMSSFTHRRQFRGGQIAVGLVILAIGWMGGFQLGFAGSALTILGGVGALHGLFFPTRWAEISGKSPDGQRATIRIQCVRKQTAKAIINLVKRRMNPVSPEMTEKG